VHDLVLVQLPRTARASLCAAFATVGVTVHLADRGDQRPVAAGPSAPVATVLRHPVHRLQSCFHQRVRAGRPHRERGWSDSEAAFFAAIRSFDQWGEAICSTDEFYRSAADRGLLLWDDQFGSLATVATGVATGAVIVAGSFDDLPAAAQRLAALIGSDTPTLPTDPAVVDTTPASLPRAISPLAALGMRMRLADEIERYEQLLGAQHT